jgi:RIO kinase 1
VSLNYLEADDYNRLVARFGLPMEDAYVEHPGKKKDKPRPNRQQKVAEVAEALTSAEGQLNITYKPARYEAVWLYDSLRPFYTQELVDDVLALVKGGKEANVYLCHGATPAYPELLAVKVYRPRQFRNLRNDVTYREGRELVNSLGITIKNRNNREMRAIHNNTSFGAELKHVSWLMHEFITLQRLHSMGAAVPRPISTSENAILMEYIGDRHRPAPALSGIGLEQHEASRHFAEVLRNIELMLSHRMIHGDLSAYNILYWQGNVTLIDFPQVTMSESNHNAFRIFERDVRRVCDYFAGQGVVADSDAITRSLWEKYVRLAPGYTMQDGA